ncbi:MAG: glycerol-3-phosphate dehydrogenase/oxidase [Candidatus Limnocylindrales bacterium]
MNPTEGRARAIEALRGERFDVLIVGGGITGTGALLDAVSRGLRAALIEQDDLAVGTSSRSSKLIHGGLRYLEQFRFGLVREALAERRTLMRIAPHLVHLEPFTVPLHGSPLQVPYLGAGLVLYGLLGAGFPRYLTPGGAKRAIPALRAQRLRGAFVYRDGVEDDARLVVAVARTAIERGGVLATRVRATGLTTSADGRSTGVEAMDLVSGEGLRIAADSVIDATGATGGPGGPFAHHAGEVRVMPSVGIHIVLDRARIPASGGLTMRIPGRVLFLIPWGRRWIVGTTDHPWDGPVDRPTAPADQVDEVLANLNETIDPPVGRADVIATFAGIRPLAASDESTVKASREHVVESPIPGLLTVRGGKYTTYRRIARDVVDAALGPKRGRSPSATADLVLAGGAPSPAPPDVARDLDPALLAALAGRYGSETSRVLELGAERGLLGRLHPDADHIEAEAVWAVEQELAWSLDDILARRLRLAIETSDHGASVAERVAAIVGPALGWDDARRAAEVAAYTASAAREYGVPV